MPKIKHRRIVRHSAPQFSVGRSGRRDSITEQFWEHDKDIPIITTVPTKPHWLLPHCHCYYKSSSVISLKNGGNLYVTLSGPTARITSNGPPHTSLTRWEQLMCLVDVQVKHAINRQTQTAPCLEESPLHIPLIFPTRDTGTWTNSACAPEYSVYAVNEPQANLRLSSPIYPWPTASTPEHNILLCCGYYTSWLHRVVSCM